MKLLKELALGNIQPMARTNVPDLQERQRLREAVGRGDSASEEVDRTLVPGAKSPVRHRFSGRDRPLR